jgi:hypothetical protein
MNPKAKKIIVVIGLETATNQANNSFLVSGGFEIICCSQHNANIITKNTEVKKDKLTI